jgi:hypothetical protein
MRLRILDTEHYPWQKVHLTLMRRLLGEAPAALQMGMYRSRFFGILFMRCVQEAVRGSSEWSPHERELFVSFVSSLNACRY